MLMTGYEDHYFNTTSSHTLAKSQLQEQPAYIGRVDPVDLEQWTLHWDQNVFFAEQYRLLRLDQASEVAPRVSTRRRG